LYIFAALACMRNDLGLVIGFNLISSGSWSS
jgi:hypothetical protein